MVNWTRKKKYVWKHEKCMMWGGSAMTSTLTLYQLQVDSPPPTRTPGPPFYLYQYERLLYFYTRQRLTER